MHAARTRRVRTWLAALCAWGALLATPSAGAQDTDAGPCVPTPQYIVDRMLQMANVHNGDYVIDLGGGDGRIVITEFARQDAFKTDFTARRVMRARAGGW